MGHVVGHDLCYEPQKILSRLLTLSPGVELVPDFASQIPEVLMPPELDSILPQNLMS